MPDEVVAEVADWTKLGAPYPESLTAAGPRASLPASPPEPHAMALFSNQVRPVLEKQCVKCHGGGMDPRKLEIPGHKRLDIDFGEPIRQIIA